MRRLHDVEQAAEVQPVGLQQHASGVSARQLLLRLGAHPQEGVRQADALHTAQVAHIRAAHGKHGLVFHLQTAQSALLHGMLGIVHRALLRRARAQQGPAHPQVHLGALVVAAEGIGHRLARVVHACAAKQLGTTARLQGGAALAALGANIRHHTPGGGGVSRVLGIGQKHGF